MDDFCMVNKKSAFEKEKARLRIVYKRYKVGLLKYDDIGAKDRALLEKYYGC